MNLKNKKLNTNSDSIVDNKSERCYSYETVDDSNLINNITSDDSKG